MKKIRVLFPYVEAGLGHIMPMRSIAETFEKKYGDRVEVVTSDFFTEGNDRHLIKYEKMISNQVRTYNRFPAIGHTANFFCDFFGATLSSFGAMALISPFAYKRGVAHMKELAPDVVFSTHWVTNYYAEHLKNKPLTVMYCPDAVQNKLFEYHSDLNMISMPSGYRKALKKRKYTEDNMKMVPFLIRNGAFTVNADKKAARRSLGLPEDNFTVLLAEGGYGIGKMEAMVKMLVAEHLPLTVIAVCGKNEKLYREFLSLEVSDEVTFRPYALADNMFELDAASDVFCGKSGNILAEATFFGDPTIVTNCSNMIERNIADHYINTVGCAVKETSAKRAVALIKTFAADPSLLEPYRRAALAYHDNFGSSKAADELWRAIVGRYPEIEKNQRIERVPESRDGKTL